MPGRLTHRERSAELHPGSGPDRGPGPAGGGNLKLRSERAHRTNALALAMVHPAPSLSWRERVPTDRVVGLRAPPHRKWGTPTSRTLYLPSGFEACPQRQKRVWRHPGESLRRRTETSIEWAGNGHIERPGSLTTKQRVKSQIPIPLCGLEAFACGPAVKVSPSGTRRGRPMRIENVLQSRRSLNPTRAVLDQTKSTGSRLRSAAVLARELATDTAGPGHHDSDEQPPTNLWFGGWCSLRLTLESLILAQDERWRRA